MTVMRCAVVSRNNKKVVNIILADPAVDRPHAGTDLRGVAPGEMVGLGWVRRPNEDVFDPPLGQPATDNEG